MNKKHYLIISILVYAICIPMLYYLPSFIYFFPTAFFGLLSEDNNRIFSTGLTRWVSLSMLFAFITASVLLFAVDLIMDKIETMRNLGNKIEPVVKLGKKFIHPSENCKQKKREKLYEKIDTICAISYAQQSCQEDVFTDREVFIGLFNQKCANAFDELNLKCFGGKNEEFQRKAIEYRKKSDDCQIIIDKIKGSTSLLK